MTGNVFQHHNRIIDQHADAQRQPTEGHDVQGQAAEGHQGKGEENRHRNRAADDQGAAQIAQKQVHHQHRQQRAADHGGAGVTQRMAHIKRLIADRIQADIIGDQVL